jgi:hypothetical protein
VLTTHETADGLPFPNLRNERGRVEDLEVVCAPDLTIEIGGVPIRLRTKDSAYFRLLQDRYAGFVNLCSFPALELEINLVPPVPVDPEEQVRVTNNTGPWSIQRSDFQAGLDLALGQGWIRQPAHPYATDCVLRIIHTLLLAGQGGFLLHSASALRNTRAYLFFGRSGAGKSTILRLAPPDVTLLTDEVSYVRKEGDRFVAYGTPFTGELDRPGDNVSAPLCGLYSLVQGRENRVEPLPPAEAVHALLECILFFADDPELVKHVFHSACELVARIPMHRLTFLPDARVWELIA